MKKLLLSYITVFFALAAWTGTVNAAADVPPAGMEKQQITPCVKALLDGQPLAAENGLNKNSEGTLQVELDESSQVYFNLVLKSNVGKNEPPVYLRFIKVDRLDIRKVLRYANIGDEIFIEPYSREGFKCLPSHFVVT